MCVIWLDGLRHVSIGLPVRSLGHIDVAKSRLWLRRLRMHYRATTDPRHELHVMWLEF